MKMLVALHTYTILQSINYINYSHTKLIPLNNSYKNVINTKNTFKYTSTNSHYITIDIFLFNY